MSDEFPRKRIKRFIAANRELLAKHATDKEAYETLKMTIMRLPFIDGDIEKASAFYLDVLQSYLGVQASWNNESPTVYCPWTQRVLYLTYGTEEP